MSQIIGTDGAFNPQQQAALKEIVGYMIPAGSGRPAASDDALFAEILAALV